LQNQTSSENQLAPSYYLRLTAAILILAAVWFGSNFFQKRSSPEKIISASPELPASAFAASLPVSQNAFLVPSSDSVLPIRKWGVDEPQLSAQSVYAVDIDSGKVLISKQSDSQRPIASLSKLMTALVVMEKADLSDEIIVSKSAVETEGEMGGLAVGEKLPIESLLWVMLMESSNDAAVALSEHFSANGGGQFVNFMNQKAVSLGLKQTSFQDPSGLDTQNLSTAREIAQIMNAAIKYPLLAYIMRTPEKEIVSPDNKFKHQLKNTDKLLASHQEIIAGKTGYIDEAGGCITVASRSPKKQSTIINVVLGSQDRFLDMEKILDWEKEAFIW